MSGVKTGYLCVQGWSEGAPGVTVGTVVSGNSNTSILNAEAAASQNLGDYTILEGDSGADVLQFDVPATLTPDSTTLDGKYCVGLIGVRIAQMTEDVVVRATLESGSQVYETAATCYAQEMERDLPSLTEGHELFGSGLANFMFHDLPASVFNTDLSFTLRKEVFGDFASTDVFLGSVFVGVQLDLSVNRDTVQMGFRTYNDETMTRGGNDISSNGVLLRSLAFEAKQMTFAQLSGSDSAYYSSSQVIGANIMRAAISNIGTPMVLSLAPYPVDEPWTESLDDAGIAARQRARRQNFFAMYGRMERQIDVNVDGSFADEQEQLYRTRMRFTEKR